MSHAMSSDEPRDGVVLVRLIRLAVAPQVERRRPGATVRNAVDLIAPLRVVAGPTVDEDERRIARACVDVPEVDAVAHGGLQMWLRLSRSLFDLPSIRPSTSPSS